MFDMSLRTVGYATGVAVFSFGLAKLSSKKLNQKAQEMSGNIKKVYEAAQRAFALAGFCAGAVACINATGCLSKQLVTLGWSKDLAYFTSDIGFFVFGSIGIFEAFRYSIK